jgi:DUF971 family protein
MSQPAAPFTSLAAPVPAPTQIAISEDLYFLDVTTAQGEEIRLAAGRLRGACKCAHCIRARIDGAFPQRFDGIAVVQVAAIGDYAINLGFSDGHARGIYPWAYLLGLKDS